jgi:ribonuclease HI
MNIEVYTDGSGMSKLTPGGYGWVIIIDGEFHSEGSGHLDNASNNDAELSAAIAGLAAVHRIVYPPIDVLGNITVQEKVPPTITLVSDSQIILGWASGTYAFKQLGKTEKYQQLKALMQRLNANTRWVKGHAGDRWNTRCDQLANAARLNIDPNTKRHKNKPKNYKSIVETKNYKSIVETLLSGTLPNGDLVPDTIVEFVKNETRKSR